MPPSSGCQIALKVCKVQVSKGIEELQSCVKVIRPCWVRSVMSCAVWLGP